MAYTGRDGLQHQETRIDWDIKTKVSTHVPEDLTKLKAELSSYRKSLICRILATNPASCGERYFDYVDRNIKTKTVSWNVAMVSDEGIDIDALRDMTTIIEKRDESLKLNQLDLKTPQVNK